MKGFRRSLVGLAAACFTMVSIIGSHLLLQVSPTSAASLTLEEAGLTLTEMAEGVYGLVASTDFPPENPSTTAICNAGIVIGSDGVLVIDPFHNEALAQLAFDTVASLTNKPVTHVVNTHYHFDHTGGNSVARGQAVPIVGRGPIRDYMLTRNLEQDADPTPPDIVVSGATDLWLGDRQVQLSVFEGHSSGTDLVAYVPDANVLFTGDLVFNQRIPYVSDGNVTAWQASLATLQATYPTARVLPGHGDGTGPAGLQAQSQYFEALVQRVLDWKAQGVTVEEALATVEGAPDPYQSYLFQALYPGNVETAFAQITP